MSSIANSVKIHLKFYSEFLRKRFFIYGLTMAMVAYALRAVASGMFIPYSVQKITNGLYDRSQSLVTQGLWLLAVSGAIYALTEWGFRPFWNSIAESIRSVKIGLIENLASKGDNKDTIGRIVNDVDFVLWNIGGLINSFVPNMLTAIVAEITIFAMSPTLGLIQLSGLPAYMAILEHYVKNVEKARTVERSAYSESIHAASEYLEGRAGADAFTSALNRWRRGIGANIHLDRVYWSSSFATSYLVPVASAIVGIGYVNDGKLSVGSLIGMLTAALTMHTALVNALWGICLLGQNVVPINRILSIKQANAQKTEALAQPRISTPSRTLS